MATATIQSQRGHTLRNWLLAGLGVLVLAGLIAGAIALIASSDGGSTTAGHQRLGSIATRVEGHAEEVRAHAERMIAAGEAESQDLWVEQGTALLAEARRLEGAASQIVAIERDRSILYDGSGVDIYRLRGDGNALRDAGRTMVAHGKEFAATADQMVAQAQEIGSTELSQTAELMRTSAAAIESDGQAVIGAGQVLVDEAEQLERSLGH